MVNLREEKKLKAEFENFIEKNSQNSMINLNNIDFDDIKKEEDLLKDFPNDFYCNFLKKNKIIEKTIQLNQDSKIDVSGFFILNIIIKKDMKLTLNYNNEKNSCSYINIIVEDAKKLILEELQNSKNSYIFTNILLNDNSKLKHGKILNSAIYSHSNAYLNKNSNYDFVCSYFLEKSVSYMKNSSYALQENTTSSIIVNGGVINSSSLINDGIVNISQKAGNSSGHQKLNNLILDTSSKIISEPILEIDNNNVSCSHGCTISQISEEIDFYCNSRGLKKSQAIELFLEGFNNLVLEHTNK